MLSCLNELMKKGIIKPEVILNNNCDAVEKQLYSILINDKQLLHTINYDNSASTNNTTNTNHVNNIFLSSIITNYMDRILIPELAGGLDLQITTDYDGDSDVYDDQIDGTDDINSSSCNNSSDISHSHNYNKGTSHIFVNTTNDDGDDDINMCHSDNCDNNNNITHHSNTIVASKSRIQSSHTKTAIVEETTTTTAIAAMTAAIPLNNLSLKFTPEQYLYILAIHSEVK